MKAPLMNLLVVMMAMLCVCLFYTPADAIEKDIPFEDLLEMSLEDLQNIEVSVASKRPRKQNMAPSSVTVFTRQEILAMGITSVEQLMNFVPGFQSTRESVLGDGFMVAGRGQSTPQASYNILFLLNGQRLNTELSGGALDVNRFIPLHNVKQVEIIRGPGSALYGTSAYTGVVNITTEPTLNEVFVGRGSLGSNIYYLNASKRFSDSHLTLSARHFGDDGQPYGEHLTRQINPKISSVLDPREGNDIALSYRRTDKLSIHLRHTDRSESGFFQFLLRSQGSPEDIATQEQESITIKYSPWKGQGWQVELGGGYVNSKTESGVRTTTADGTQTFLQRAIFKEEEWHFSLDAGFKMNDRHEVLVGGEWRNPDLLEATNFDNSADSTGDLAFAGHANAEGDRHIIGLYLQDQYRFSRKLEMTLGLRHDDYSGFGGNTSTRAAWVYSSDFDATFKLIYGEAFRVPSFRQSGSSVVGNPGLEPEKVKTLELAWIQVFKQGQTGLTYFHSDYQNKITTIPRPTPPGRIFVNSADITASGFEWDMLAQFGHLLLRGAYTYLLETETNPRFVAERTLSLIANYRYERWNFNLNGYYHDEMEQIALIPVLGPTTITLDDYWVLNSAVRFSFSPKVTFVTRVENILDEDFTSPTRNLLFTSGLPNRGRTVFFGMEMSL